MVDFFDSPKIKTLLEDDALLVVKKPSGIPSHSLSDPDQVTVESLLRKNRTDLPDLRLLHRLDTGTSGVLMFAKNEAIYLLMREKFKYREIQKFYRAWSNSKWDKVLDRLPLQIHTPLAHHPKSKKKMVVLVPGKKISYRGKAYPAETIIHAAREISYGIIEFKIQIITGVTHQIRAHLNHIGFPLLGDLNYTKTFNEINVLVSPLGSRLGLHAERIAFELKGNNYEIEDLPEDL